jgi:hypothetical protein
VQIQKAPKLQQQNQKLHQEKPKMQVTLQAPSVSTKVVIEKKVQQQVVAQEVDKKPDFVKTTTGKDDVVKNIAKVLKKVQTQKIVANVSRPLYKSSTDTTRPVTQKFESYEDFINASKPSLVEEVKIVEKTSDAVQVASNLHESIADVAAVVMKKPESVVQRVPLKMKRRPLSTENSGVSGITRSSSFVKTTQPKSSDEVVVDTVLDKAE